MVEHRLYLHIDQTSIMYTGMFDILHEDFTSMTSIIYFINIVFNDFIWKAKSYQTANARKVEYFHPFLCCGFGIFCQFYYRQVCILDTSSIILVVMFCSIFLIGSTMYAVLLNGYGSDPALESFQKSDDWLGLDSDVSIWTNTAVTWPLLNLIQILAPVPGIISGIYLSYGCTEDVLFVFAILSLVPVFAAQISSLRYLGILGMIFAAGKGYRLTDQQQRSDRLI